MKPLFSVFLLFLMVTVRAGASAEGEHAGPISVPTPTPAAPVWGKLVLTNNSVTCYYATGADTPTSWTQIGTSQPIAFSINPLLVGVYACSHDGGALCNATIDNFSITPAPAYRLADCDIGSPTLMGAANLINGVWNLAGCGWDVWSSTDQFNFQPWLVWGNCTVICRVTSVGTGVTWRKVGIMVRQSYNSGSAYALFCATGAAGVDFQWRGASNANPDVTQLVAPPATGVLSSVSMGFSPTAPSAYVLRP